VARFFHPLLTLIASATDRELAKYVQFLKEENKILRGRIKGEIHTKPEERRRLLEFGKAIGRAIEELITIVSPSTFCRWMRDEHGKKTKNPKGGQRKPREVRELVIEIARTTGFGYTRILGELRKIGIKKISRQTVRNILKEEGISPGPDRTSDSWENFVKRHGETLWAVDFFTVKAVTAHGIRNLYLMAFLSMKTREAIVSTCTTRPNSSWVVQQTKQFVEQTAGRKEKPAVVMHDRDTKFTRKFVATLEASGIETNPLPVASPNLNGRVERFIQTIKHECLFRFILFGRKHLDHIVREWLGYYNSVRSHTECGHLPPVAKPPDELATVDREKIVIRSYVGGLVRSFERRAA
jgi:putative transposase